MNIGSIVAITIGVLVAVSVAIYFTLKNNKNEK